MLIAFNGLIEIDLELLLLSSMLNESAVKLPLSTSNLSETAAEVLCAYSNTYRKQSNICLQAARNPKEKNPLSASAA